jgi:hypothetical protein
MYRSCLFCSADLGRNEAIEHFPVGRRLAFDAATGRLWVVCRACERWNLTPLEERWEAIEECERAFAGTRLRVSTDQIGLARLKEGLELVRIGAPLRPEMAAWRYGDQFGRRRRAAYGKVALAAAAVGSVIVAGPVMGLVSLGGLPAWNLAMSGYKLYRAKRVTTHVETLLSGPEAVSIAQLADTCLSWRHEESRWELEIPRRSLPIGRRLFAEMGDPRQTHEIMRLRGAPAERALRQLLPHVNAAGGSADDVSDAVQVIEHTPDVHRLIRNTAKHHGSGLHSRDPVRLARLPAHIRLALEMSTHEESERRALEGELHVLAAAWRDADEVAAIADDMFLPKTIDDELARLKRRGVSDGRVTG